MRLVDQRNPVLPIDEDGGPGWQGRIRHANDGVDQGNEAYRSSVRKTVRNVRTRTTTGMLPWNERLSIIDKVVLGRSLGMTGQGGSGVDEPTVRSAQQAYQQLEEEG